MFYYLFPTMTCLTRKVGYWVPYQSAPPWQGIPYIANMYFTPIMYVTLIHKTSAAERNVLFRDYHHPHVYNATNNTVVPINPFTPGDLLDKCRQDL